MMIFNGDVKLPECKGPILATVICLVLRVRYCVDIPWPWHLPCHSWDDGNVPPSGIEIAMAAMDVL